MYNRNECFDLFAEIIDPTEKLTKNLEQKILSYLEIKDFINFVMLNKTMNSKITEDKIWNRKITEEVKCLKKCVTIYTWFGGDSSCEPYWDNGTGTRGRMGHSALRTYGNSEGEEGIYVSFYPGDCHNSRRIAGCRKSVSHFHTWNQEMSKDIRESAQAIDLYGLDVDAIHQSFRDMHDNQMNSNKNWGYRYNCSDVVLYLLGQGNLFDKIGYKPYGWKTIVSMGMFGATFGIQAFILWIENLEIKFNGERNGFKRFKLNSNLSNYTYNPSVNFREHIVNILLRSLIGGFISAGMMETYDENCYSKNFFTIKNDHKTKLNKTRLKNTFLAGSAGFSTSIVESIFLRYLPTPGKYYLYLIDKIANTIDYSINNGAFQFIQQKFIDLILSIKVPPNFPYPSIIVVPIASIVLITAFLLPPYLQISFNFIPKYFFDTTTTPRYVFEIIKPLENKLKNESKSKELIHEEIEIKNEENKNIANTIWENKYKLGMGLLITSCGFFAIKQIVETQNVTLSNISNNI